MSSQAPGITCCGVFHREGRAKTQSLSSGHFDFCTGQVDLFSFHRGKAVARQTDVARTLSMPIGTTRSGTQRGMEELGQTVLFGI